MVNVIRGIEIDMNYSRNGPEPDETFPTYIRNVTLRNVLSQTKKERRHWYLVNTLEINCLEQYPCKGDLHCDRSYCLCTHISITDIRLEHVDLSDARGYSMSNIDGAHLDHFRISSTKRLLKKKNGHRPQSDSGAEKSSFELLLDWTETLTDSKIDWVAIYGEEPLKDPMLYCKFENISNVVLVNNVQIDCTGNSNRCTFIAVQYEMI